MQSLDPVLISEFTRDPVAERDTFCESTKCRKQVLKGKPYIYVGTKSGKQGRFVCAECHRRYQLQSSAITLSRDALIPDPDAVRRSINAAHSRGSINPPPVVPINQRLLDVHHNALVMPPPPPPPPPASGLSRRLNVRVPSAAWQIPNAQPVVAPAVGLGGPPIPAGVGYSNNHLVYHLERNRRESHHYAVTAETITLSLSALHDSGKRGRSRGTPFGGICEGVKDVDARLTAPQLIHLARKVIVPCILNFCPQFPWRLEEFVVHDEAWVDLAKYSEPSLPYFYNSCFNNSNRKTSKGRVFKTRICPLNVVVPQAQWSEYEAFIDQESTRKCVTHEPALCPPSPGPSSRLRLPSSESSGPPHHLGLSRPSVRAYNTSEPDLHLSPEPQAVLDQLILPEEPDQLLGSVSKPAPINITLSKRTRLHSASVSSVTTKSPPAKRLAPPDVPSPDQNDIKAALRSSGAAVLNVDEILKQTTQLIDFHPIPTLPFADILKPERRSFKVKTAELYSGQIRVDSSPHALIGVGAFKTAQPAQLLLSTLRSSGLGSKSCEDVVAKRPYIRRNDLERRPPFPRYSTPDELTKLLREANVLYWAKALLDVTYAFIDRALAKSSRPPIFDIPRLRFVDAGLALGYSSAIASGPKASSGLRKAGTVSIAYLVEELIPNPESFVKFIHNGSCMPLLEPDEPDYNIAEFLAFTQHVQYIKTGGLAYISDYQGSAHLLTDPQILTHPTVGEGDDMFCEGNLEKAVEEFTKDHVCNMYCKWPGFRLTEFSRSTEVAASNVS